MMSVAMQPVAPGERIVVLDVLRGFALLGILLMNIEAFVGPLAAASGVDPSLHGIDRIADALVYVFVQGKFYTLFSLLFGMGFAVMAQRAERGAGGFAAYFLRRSVGLLVIGLLHALLLWSGDVLVSYALLAMLLVPLRSLPSRWLPLLALLVYLSSAALVLLCGAVGSLAQLDPLAGEEWRQAMHTVGQEAAQLVVQQRQAYGAGSYMQATVQRLHDLNENLQGLLLNAPVMLGMFMLGSWFVRAGVIDAPQRHAGLFSRLRWLAWPLGLLAMLASLKLVATLDMGRMDLTVAFAYALGSVAGLLMCLGYMAWVVRFAPLLQWLAPAGRMALSNYVMQSLLCTLIFYGYGLGYFEQLSRVWQLPFAVLLFLLQVLISRCWLSYCSFGPLEWLWRGFIYLQSPRLRRQPG
jgi:uncharacterized protein